jgi:anaerobic magnesium-protoporphyrin IX monomethyl ester cyclase
MKLLLATLHAKYVHNSLALPYLAAYCADIEGIETVIREFTINEPADEPLRRAVAEEPDVAAFSCYIWNIGQTLRLVADLKKVRPETFILLGGPEAAHDAFEIMERHPAVDCIVRGEGEATFRDIVEHLARADKNNTGGVSLAEVPGLICRAGGQIIETACRPPIPDLDSIPSPFAAGLADLDKPLVYYETSRGCPFSCAFCMSSLEQGVRSFSPERIKDDLWRLMERGVATVKLADRTFNFEADRADDIWEFILMQNRTSRFHFEITADLLSEENFRRLSRVPSGLFRFEIGVQSGNEATLAQVGRKSDLARLHANVRRLRAETGVIIHLDLVAGLPGENFAGFLDSLHSLFELAPHHIQVEPLKVLKGAPMRRIAEEEGYAYSASPPYRILRTPWLSFEEINRIEAIARLLDLYYNSGRFAATLAALARSAPLARIFADMATFRESVDQEAGRSLAALFEALWDFAGGLTAGEERERLREALCYDYCLAEYPAAGRLPRFFPEGGATMEVGEVREKRADLARRLGINAGSRVRTFGWRFSVDPRRSPEETGEITLLFVYISTPGKRFEVRVQEVCPCPVK